MTRTVSTTLKSILLVGLAIVFCTKLPSTMDKLEQNIGATSLVVPADGRTDNILEPRLAWRTVGGATRYYVQVSTTSDFSKIVLDSGVTDTFVVVTGLAYKTIYYWRVQVHDETSSSDWTTHRTFTTIVEPQTPAAVLPNDTAQGQPTSLKLIWNSAVGAASYFVQVASDTGFTAIVAVDSTLADTVKVISNLSNNSTYFWRVRSRNPGGASAWTVPRSFTTIVAAPRMPILSSPASGATNQQLSLVLTWNMVLQASGYYLQIATDIAFANIFMQDSTLTDTSRAVSGLANGVLYYWRVKARNDGGVSGWSNLSGFTTFSAVPQQPVLIAPSNGAVDQVIPLTVNWNKATGAASYHLQIATDSGFAAITNADSALADTSKSVGGLANNTKYFWRVRAKNPVGVSSWSPIRIFITFAATLQTPVLRSPADGATGQPVAAVLLWQGVSGVTGYRIQLSKSSDFSTIFYQDSALTDTSKSLAGLGNSTTYFWHVRAENATGFSNWTTPWRFTTILAAPQIPALVSPADGATGQQLTLALSWNKAAGAETYHVQVSSDSNFSTTVTQDSTLTDTLKLIGGLSNNTTYFWRIGSKNAIGTSGWSGRRSFTTFAATLQMPTLESPKDGAVDQPVAPVLSWSTVANATNYQVQVSAEKDFSVLVADDATLTSGSKTLGGLLNSTIYYWRVRAKSLSGTSNWTVPFSFTTIITQPGTPSLVLPVDKAVDQPVSVVLTWNKATGSASYFVQVATDTGFTVIVSLDSTLTDTVKSITGLSNNVTYYWRVKGKNTSGYGSWSVYRNFTTVIAVPVAPALVAPVDSVPNVDLNPQLSWGTVTGAAAYHIQVSTSSDFSKELVVDDSNYVQTTKLIGPLSLSTKYYWHVNAKNAGGTSAWSAPRNFITVPPAPPAPVQVSPAKNAGDIGPTQSFSWNASPGASTYWVQIATDSSFASGIAVDKSTLTDTTGSFGSLVSNTVYFWHVNARNGGGTSAWSATWRLFTVIPAPSPAWPADGATDIALSAALQWKKAAGATSYHLRVGTIQDFSSGVAVDKSALTDTAYPIGALNDNAVYYWQVNYTNANGTSQWSTTRKFTTMAKPAAPVLFAPINYVEIVDLNPTLRWSAPSGAAHYHLQVATTNSFSGGIVFVDDSTLTDTIKAIGPLTPGVTFCWHVLAQNAGGSSDWSTTGNFAILAKPAVPVLKSPADVAVNVKLSPTLVWRSSVGATGYRMQIGTSSYFTSEIIMDDSTLTDTTRAVPSLTPGIAHFWRVQAKNAAGSSDWSNFFTFTTFPIPPAPSLTFPVDNKTNEPLSTSLHWTGVTGALFYRVQVSTKLDFSVIDVKDSTMTQTSLNLSGLSANTKHFWRARSMSADTIGDWSAARNFTTTPVIWTNVSTGLTSANVYSMIAMGGYIIAASDNGGVFVSNNSGASWSARNTGLTTLLVKQVFADGGSLFAGTANGGVFRSVDTGVSWTAVNNGISKYNSPVQGICSIGSTLFVGFNSDSGLVRSTDQGANWTVVSTPWSDHVVGVLAAIGTTLLVGTNSGLYISSDNGNSWINTGVTDVVSDFATKGDSAYAVSYQTGKTYLSTNYGASWSIAFASPLNGLAAGPMCVDVSGNRFFAGTLGSGAFMSLDNGSTWTAINDGLTTSDIMGFLVVGSNVFAGTGGGKGVFRSPLP
jgi:hypothetical protein